MINNNNNNTLDTDSWKLTIRAACLRSLENNSNNNNNNNNNEQKTFQDVLDLEAPKSFRSRSIIKIIVNTIIIVIIIRSKEITFAAEKLCKIAQIKKLLLSSEEASHILVAIKCNAHRILANNNNNNNQIALGLFPIVSMINHSCVPNCTHYFRFSNNNKPQLVIRAIRDIKPDEEVFE